MKNGMKNIIIALVPVILVPILLHANITKRRSTEQYETWEASPAASRSERRDYGLRSSEVEPSYQQPRTGPGSHLLTEEEEIARANAQQRFYTEKEMQDTHYAKESAREKARETARRYSY